MSSKTKIIVLHLKELIYTGIFVALGILFIVLLIIMFLPDKTDKSQSAEEGHSTQDGRSGNTSGERQGGGENIGNLPPGTDTFDAPTHSGNIYIPGVYTTELILNDQAIDVEVIVDKDYISSIRLVNLNEAVATMYPLLEPTFDSISQQIYEKQSLDNITYLTDSKYTSLVLLEAISNSLEKALASPPVTHEN